MKLQIYFKGLIFDREIFESHTELLEMKYDIAARVQIIKKSEDKIFITNDHCLES